MAPSSLRSKFQTDPLPIFALGLTIATSSNPPDSSPDRMHSATAFWPLSSLVRPKSRRWKRRNGTTRPGSNGGDGAGGFVEVPAVLVRVRRARRGEQGVADREALVLPYELQRVVGCARDVRQMAFRERFLVAGHEGVEQQDVAPHLAAAPGGDAPKLAARVYGDGRSLETPVVRREKVEGPRPPRSRG